MLNSRLLGDLHPVVANKAQTLIHNCAEKGLKIISTSTKRDDEYQATLYAQGRTKPGSIVTNMEVTGAHGFGLALDVVPVIGGKAVWNDEQAWQIIGTEAKKLGFVWGGDWKSFIDKPHLEFTDGLKFSDLRAGKRPLWFAYDELKDYVALRTEFQPATIDYLDAYKYANGLFTKLAALL